MEGLSIIIPVFNKFETTVKCIDSIMERNGNRPFEIIIVDNGSTDETQKTFSDNNKLKYLRNDQNLGVAKACNIGAATAEYDVLCFMHNDVFVFQQDWTAAAGDFITKTANSGIVGLYGAKTLRRDGTFRGKTIVHAKKDSPSITRPFEKVAVVDGLLMAVKRSVFENIDGFNNNFTVHYYDKDFSMRAIRKGYDNYILNIPFEHRCGTTRGQIKKEDAIRDTAQEKFIEIWGGLLPADVSTKREKIGYLFKNI